MNTASSPAPLHDIVGPVPFFPYTTSEIVIAALILLALLAAVGGIVWKLRQQPPLGPREEALQRLAALKKELMLGSDHDFGTSVSTLFRNYLNEMFGLAAPRQTTEEFLKSLHGHERFSQPEREALSDFLKQSDVLKFAQGTLQAEERLALIEAAERFIQKGMEVSA